MAKEEEDFDTNEEGSDEYRDFVSEFEERSKLDTEPVSCRVVGCNTITTSSSGYCDRHQGELKTANETHVLKCSECPDSVREVCDFCDNPTMMCHYEVALSSDDFEKKDSVAGEFKKALNNMRIMVARIQRSITGPLSAKGNLSLLGELRRYQMSFSEMQEKYLRFMGWDRAKASKEERIARMELLRDTFKTNRIEVATITKKDKKADKTKPIMINGNQAGREVDDPIPSENMMKEVLDELPDAIVSEEAIHDDTMQDDIQKLESLIHESEIKEIEVYDVDESALMVDEGSGATKRKPGRRRT
jgi:hypothetical protein